MPCGTTSLACPECRFQIGCRRRRLRLGNGEGEVFGPSVVPAGSGARTRWKEAVAQQNLLSFHLHRTGKKSERERDMRAESRWERGEAMQFSHRWPPAFKHAHPHACSSSDRWPVLRAPVIAPFDQREKIRGRREVMGYIGRGGDARQPCSRRTSRGGYDRSGVLGSIFFFLADQI